MTPKLNFIEFLDHNHTDDSGDADGVRKSNCQEYSIPKCTETPLSRKALCQIGLALIQRRWKMVLNRPN
jgi:hypothetical protein